MSNLKLSGFWPTLIPIVGLLLDSFSGVIQNFVNAHPTVGLIIVTLLTGLANAVNTRK